MYDGKFSGWKNFGADQGMPRLSVCEALEAVWKRNLRVGGWTYLCCLGDDGVPHLALDSVFRGRVESYLCGRWEKLLIFGLFSGRGGSSL